MFGFFNRQPASPAVVEDEPEQVQGLIDTVRERLRSSFPEVLFITDPTQILKDWKTPLGDLPYWCTEARIRRFLRATNNNVDTVVSRLARLFEIEKSTRGPQSQAVEDCLNSRRFNYIGTGANGAITLAVDCLWGTMLDVEGGLDTVLTALTVFMYRRLWSMAERDIGRRACLADPQVAALFVGGAPPISFVRAGLQFFDEHYPGGLATSVSFETHAFKGMLSRNAFKFLPKNGTDYHWTNSRERVLELLEIDEHCVPESMLYLDVPASSALAATSAIDREWLDEIKTARDKGVNLCEADNMCSVKNTFVELGDGENAEFARRGRALSDSEEPWTPRKKALDDEAPHVPPLQLAEPSLTCAASPCYVVPAAQQQIRPVISEQPADQQDQPGKKRRQSGWTRQRRSRAIAKLKKMDEAHDNSLQEDCGIPNDEQDGFQSPRSQ